MLVDAPMPTAAPKAAERFMKGKVMPNPAMASVPTTWPMNARSMMLYSEEAVMAMIAGMAYRMSSSPTGFVPNSSVASLLSII